MSVWLAKWTNQARRQRQAIVEIERVGGSVYFGESIFASIPYVDDVFLPVEEVKFPGDASALADEGPVIASLKRLPHLQRILLFPPQDQMMPKLQNAFPDVECKVITSAFIFWNDSYSSTNDG